MKKSKVVLTSTEREFCLDCGCGLRDDSSRAPLCYKCWKKTQEAQASLKQKGKVNRLRQRWESWAS